MNKLQGIFIIFLLITFFSGIYVILSMNTNITQTETMDNMDNDIDDKNKPDSNPCPDLLVQKGGTLLLYNSKQPIEDGINPIPFFNLDEYINYLEIQKKKGITCPILYLKMEYNTQGQEIYRMRPSPFDLQGGLPTMIPPPLTGERSSPLPTNQIIKHIDANREHYPYNSNNYSGFDPQGLNTGQYTDIDIIHDSTKTNKLSDNPMDPNWGGIQYTNQMVDSGKYADNNVYVPMLYQPKTMFLPNAQNIGSPPIDLL